MTNPAEAGVARRLALLFTDVVDSTKLSETLGDPQAARLWAAHDACARDLIVRHGGREVDRTDGFFVLFEAVDDGAAFALDYHAALQGLGLRARVGLHEAEVLLRPNEAAHVARGAKPFEVEGLATPFTARIMALAGGGQTLLSAGAAAVLAPPAGTRCTSHGHYRLKGIADPVEVFEFGRPETAPFTPPADAEKAYRVLRAGDLWRPLREVRHNLPAERDAFVGRAAELQTLARRLDGGSRLLTVLGVGGTGKTRLVRRYGWTWLGDWPGGVVFCDLSEARSLEGICFAVASALEVPLGKTEPVRQLGHAIAGRGRVLVVLDNFEQVAALAADTLGRWVDGAAEAAFVVTSRERLHLPGEEVLPVEPLPVGREAVELFVARARAQRPDFDPTAAERPLVLEAVRLLDGLPLAIELAAARMRLLSPAQLVERLRDRFRLLAGARGAAARQATLKAVIDWSWDLLSGWEQAALAQCSVFDGGFTLEAAEAVLDLAPWAEAPPAMDVVQSLLDKSLLRTWDGSARGRFELGEPYFGMYLSIHEYAAGRLQAQGPGAAEATERRHGVFFARYGSDPVLEQYFRSGAGRRLALALELDNLVAACRRAVRREDGEVAATAYRAAWEVLETRGPFATAAQLGDLVCALPDLSPLQRALATWTRALVDWRLGRLADAESRLHQALQWAREAGSRMREASVLGSLCNLYFNQGRAEQALAVGEQALALQRALGNRRAAGTVLGNLGNAHFIAGRLHEARAIYEQALDIHREVGNRLLEGSVIGNLAGLDHEQGRPESALAHCRQAIEIAREIGDRRSEAMSLGNLGVLHQAAGELEEARRCQSESMRLGRELGDRNIECLAAANLGELLIKLGEDAAAQASLQHALQVCREQGNQVLEGTALTLLASLALRGGRADEAAGLLQAGETVLRRTGNGLYLARLLCVRGLSDLRRGERAAAQQALAEAEAAAQAMGAGAGSELQGDLAALRAALA